LNAWHQDGSGQPFHLFFQDVVQGVQDSSALRVATGDKLSCLADVALAAVHRRHQDADRIAVVVHRVRLADLGAVALVAAHLCCRVRAPLPFGDLRAHKLVLAVALDAVLIIQHSAMCIRQKSPRVRAHLLHAVAPNFATSASASTQATIASPTTDAAGTAHTSERWYCVAAPSPVARSTERKGVTVVRIGSIAARTTIGSPLLMPPSMPPARFEARMTCPTCSRLVFRPRLPLPQFPDPDDLVVDPVVPGRRAVSNAGPISTPLMAWMLITAMARRASSRRA
jgi:hypothetical protein